MSPHVRRAKYSVLSWESVGELMFFLRRIKADSYGPITVCPRRSDIDYNDTRILVLYPDALLPGSAEVFYMFESNV
jgi:hypothetical protein